MWVSLAHVMIVEAVRVTQTGKVMVGGVTTGINSYLPEYLTKLIMYVVCLYKHLTSSVRTEKCHIKNAKITKTRPWNRKIMKSWNIVNFGRILRHVVKINKMSSWTTFCATWCLTEKCRLHVVRPWNLDDMSSDLMTDMRQYW